MSSVENTLSIFPLNSDDFHLILSRTLFWICLVNSDLCGQSKKQRIVSDPAAKHAKITHRYLRYCKFSKHNECNNYTIISECLFLKNFTLRIKEILFETESFRLLS